MRKLGAEPPPGGSAWPVVWATTTDADPRLVFHLAVGPVAAVAFAERDQRPWLAIASPDHRLRVVDALSVSSRELPCDEPVLSLAFAVLSGEPVLVSGHRGGRLRIFDLAGGSPRRTLELGDHDLREIQVSHSVLVTRDAECRVRRFSLPSGEPMAAAAEQGLSRVRRIVLSTVDGRKCATVMDEAHSIGTLEISTGKLIAPPITAHRNQQLSQVMETASPPSLAVVNGILAVPTRWRVHLWNLRTSQQETAPLPGPVANSIVQAVRWQDRDLLLTASSQDGVVALWDIAEPWRPAPGHDQRISCVAQASDEIVVSADSGGTVVARFAADGRPVTSPLSTGVEGTRALAAWTEDDAVVVALGAGSRHLRDGKLHRWSLQTPSVGRSTEAHQVQIKGIFRVPLPTGQDALVTTGPGGMLKLWRPDDSTLIGEIDTGRTSTTGFAAGVADGRPIAALSFLGQPMTVYTLDDLSAPPLSFPYAHRDIVLALAGSHIIAARTDVPHAIRAWHLDGWWAGVDLRGSAEVTAVACRAWPAVYVGRADGTITLTDMETGDDLCPALRLPLRPASMTVTPDGDLIVGFGSDLARLCPPLPRRV